MKNVALLAIGLIMGSGSAYADCDPAKECIAGNLCYSDGAISCRQTQKCEVTDRHAKWMPLQGSGTVCGSLFKIKILDVHLKAAEDTRESSATDIVAKKCDDQEVCSFMPKVNGNPTGGLLGDPTPGSHVMITIKYICRGAMGSRGMVRLEIQPKDDINPVSFNCIE
jgi:hypothetical protein